MLDLILEALGDLLAGDSEKTAPRGRTGSGLPPEPRAPSGQDPFTQNHNPPGTPATLEDLIRGMAGKRRGEGEDASARRPARQSSRQPQRRVTPPAPRAQARQQPQSQPRRPADQVGLQASAVPDSLLDNRAANANAAPGLEFVAALRNNPDAARQAFVFAEIFGKPLADR